MTLYEQLLEFSRAKLDDFFINAKLYENQFQFSELNQECYKAMYTYNAQDNVKSVKELKAEVQGLAATCKKCGPYYMAPRNRSKMTYDLLMGQQFENIMIEFLNQICGIKALHGDVSNKQYPDCMILSGDKGIKAYFEVKYHAAPFVLAINKINRHCYEGSVTLDYKKIIRQLEIIDSDIERPVFYLHWIDYPCLKGVFFETSEQVKDYIYEAGVQFSREEREGDLDKNPKSVYLSKFYSPLLQMGTFEEFITLIKSIK